MGALEQNTRKGYFSLGFGKLNQPKNSYLRFCKGCMAEDVAGFGETYWHRLHQLPGVLVCHHHRELLQESKVSFIEASMDFFPAKEQMDTTPCEELPNNLIDKFMVLSSDSEWILQNGCRFGTYETTQRNYDLWLRSSAYRGFEGQTKHKEVYYALRNYFGDEFLKLVAAYDETPNETWTARITHFPDSLLHPMYHILMMQLLAGNTKDFFEKECVERHPFDVGPWPCHNPVCPGYLQDVIEKYDANPSKGCMHARFECPVCGMVYRRKRAMAKAEQYKRKPKVEDYGSLWYETLHHYLVEQKMTARETCSIMHCDFYTVNRHAFQKGFLTQKEVYTYSRPTKEKTSVPIIPANMSESELKQMYRLRWLDLIQNNPDAIRSRLISLDHESHLWLRKNDVEWYEYNSPSAKYTSFDWSAHDSKSLGIVREAIIQLRCVSVRPVWISRSAVKKITGLHQLSNKRTLENMPLTAAFLEANLETIEEWRKRKIVWAIQTLREQGAVITLHKINMTASMSYVAFDKLEEFARKCLKD